MTDSEFAELMFQEGYVATKLHSGEWLGVRRMAYTTALVIGLDETGYRCRWCYETTDDAVKAWLKWNGEGDAPPGPWVKQKGRDSTGRAVDRLNPRLADPEAEF